MVRPERIHLSNDEISEPKHSLVLFEASRVVGKTTGQFSFLLDRSARIENIETVLEQVVTFLRWITCLKIIFDPSNEFSTLSGLIRVSRDEVLYGFFLRQQYSKTSLMHS